MRRFRWGLIAAVAVRWHEGDERFEGEIKNSCRASAVAVCAGWGQGVQ